MITMETLRLNTQRRPLDSKSDCEDPESTHQYPDGVDDLLERSVQFRQFLKAHGDHPIHALAPELLGEVFLHCLPDLDLLERINVSADNAPLVLLRVCHHWRRVALQTPHLWTELVITCSRRVPRTPDPVMAFQRWMNSAGSLPIKIALVPTNWKERSDDVMRLLVENFHRLLELRVLDSLHSPFVTHLLLHPLPIIAPALKLIYIPSGHLNPHMHSSRLTGCIHVPNLESLCLRSPFILSLLSLTPERLQSLTLYFRQNSVADLLPLCTSLKHLELRIDSGMVQGLSSILRLPHLQHLVLHFGKADDLPLLFQKLDAPRLENLRVWAPKFRPWPQLELLFNGPSPPLRYLVLGGTKRSLQWWPADVLLPLFDLLQNLESLEFHRGIILDDTLEALIPHEDQIAPFHPGILPLLSSLTFNRCNVSGDLAVELVQSRTSAVRNHRLRHVIFEHCNLEEHHKVALEKIGQACGANIIFDGFSCVEDMW